jgi:hypothetical protein
MNGRQIGYSSWDSWRSLRRRERLWPKRVRRWARAGQGRRGCRDAADWRGAQGQAQCTVSLGSDRTQIRFRTALLHRVHLSLLKAKRRHRKVKLSYRITSKAKGSLKVKGILGGRHQHLRRRFHVKRHRGRIVATARLSRGNWLVSPRFKGTGNLASPGVRAVHAYRRQGHPRVRGRECA